MLHVAVLRNVNQGQRGHLTTIELRDAFAVAGCGDAVTFQSNGTIVFSSDDPEAVMDRVLAVLTARSGREQEGFAMALSDLIEIVDRHSGPVGTSRAELTLHAGGTLDVTDPALLSEAARRGSQVLDAGDGWIVSLNERLHESNATPIIERVTGRPATSRGMPTLIRLVARFDQG